MYDDLNLYIDGEWRSASDKGTKPVTDPANEEQLATIASATETDVDAALKAAERGFDVWR
ncbi:MAG: succinate-semialdehyde dehydrogenase/glutarate-semialdehyde dehydrogenase, partial [Ascidiaceihabitans sp.]